MRQRLLLAMVVVAIATNALAGAQRFRTATQPIVALTSPANGATLHGGQFATISWRAIRPIDGEEWEAFLSVDGGRYYSARLTPHLDLDVRTFTFVVPNVSSDDVRILIRTGDERNETIIELPQRFAIQGMECGRLRTPSDARPESARPGDVPVVMWATAAGIETEAQTKGTVTAAFAHAGRVLFAASSSTHAIVASSATTWTRFEKRRAPRALQFDTPRDVLRFSCRLNI